MQLLWFNYFWRFTWQGLHLSWPMSSIKGGIRSKLRQGRMGFQGSEQCGCCEIYWCRSSWSSCLLSVFLMCSQKVSPQYLATLLPWTVQWFVLHGESLTMCALCYIAKLLCRLVVRLHDSIRMKMSSAGSSSDSTIQSGMSAISLDRGCRIIPLCSADLSANQPEVSFSHTKWASTTS